MRLVRVNVLYHDLQIIVLFGGGGGEREERILGKTADGTEDSLFSNCCKPYFPQK